MAIQSISNSNATWQATATSSNRKATEPQVTPTPANAIDPDGDSDGGTEKIYA